MEYAAKTALGVTLLPPAFLGAAPPKAAKPGANPTQKASADAVIFLYMRGGMSQVATFDPKTDGETKGSIRPVRTKADDLEFSNLLPKLGEQAMDISVIRSMTTRTGAHSQASYVMHTGYRQRPGGTHPQRSAQVLL